ncbi:hypothetical protein BHE74_00002807 [Ensete ventricosum]|nr:hypothetical protein BHE74_00002807 [Ensete ventricosum]
MEIYADEKWKLPKKESRNSCNRSRREVAATEAAGHLLKGSGSTKEVQRKTPRSFSSRCASLVKEQRAKFYIMRQLCSTEATVIASVHMGGHSMLGCSATLVVISSQAIRTPFDIFHGTDRTRVTVVTGAQRSESDRDPLTDPDLTGVTGSPLVAVGCRGPIGPRGTA